MDWQNPSETDRVILGVIKLSAKTKGYSVPPLFINPGGPGGSGIKSLQTMGSEVQTVAGDYHTPVADERPGLIYDAYSRAIAYSGACKSAMNETGILNHLSTASSARDLLDLVEKTGHKKLRYWGFSYGTVLAGNVDLEGWFTLDHAGFLHDADNILNVFDEACHNAGPFKCALWAASADAIRDRRASILESLKDHPVILPAHSTQSGPELPLVITYSDVQRYVRVAIYKPLVHAEDIALVFAGLENRDGLPFFESRKAIEGDNSPLSELFCSVDDTPAMEPLETGFEVDAFPAIMCSDIGDSYKSVAQAAQYLEKLREASRWTGAASLMLRLPCAGWTVRSSWRHVPDLQTKQATSHPILFLNNLYDNVTPIYGARLNSAHYNGSVVLQQNSLGHCSFAGPSTCTAKHVQQYLEKGVLPDEGSECDQDYDLFQKPLEDEFMAQDELSSALWRLSQASRDAIPAANWPGARYIHSMILALLEGMMHLFGHLQPMVDSLFHLVLNVVIALAVTFLAVGLIFGLPISSAAPA
ncbi:uncharacterized protein J7T54_001749 [Emericellopsis cladophorae]|uniref:Peptidase S33 tripeptidyl aminopeptidase-like C-terminal domain-containing protein n=1 Tax=Emericellopsis cladophorae TaxID=2686198 RepID=A0A9P9Y5Y7_9HYPO|nr:uncharacterized protein J7T54_001749 [Emericellopsis cladophorae]KAI6783873.1 hypothetical protein J7T54_001749 [Emericellopsis cladophorae]